MTLQVWVRDVLEAQHVLDYESGHRYSKLQVHSDMMFYRCSCVSASPAPICPSCNCAQVPYLI